MSIFEFVTVAVSIILGLGVAELLSSTLDLLRFRRISRLHWVPPTWAAMIFLIQLQFWWSLFDLQDPAVWTNRSFLLAIATALALFAAGSLILPKRWPPGGLDLMEHFHSEGRLGVAAFAVFNILALPLNAILFGSPAVSIVTLFLVAMLLTQAGTLLAKSDRTVAVFTVVFVGLQLSVLTYTVVPQFAS